mmetsp:Transcript_6406/g.10866  ORF Transcript_6406/g.10866 Transcript_6406/m.10866 type:complete len:144 (+) Transcript_6406:55-486(+)
MLAISNLIVFVGGIVGVALILDLHKIYLSMSDFHFYLVLAVFQDSLLLAFVDLPLMVLFAKIIPEHIEGTVFAFLTGTINFSSNSLSPMVGSIINDNTVQITLSNMTSHNFVYLAWAESILSLTPLLYMSLIPLKSQVRTLQD